MKKILFLVAIMLCCATAILAQNNRISYQAVVRDTANRLVANKTVTVTVEIFNGDAQAAVYTETHTNVQTNYNGLFSLQIGGGTATGVSWDEADINWKDAKVITAVSLGGTQLATLEMPLTAVPYALYADYAEEINPDAVVVTEIYEKMLADSNALAGQITNLDSKLTSKIHEDSVALANKMFADSNALAGQITNLDSKLTSKIHEDSVALAGQITTLNTNLTSKIYEDSVALAGQITTLNTNLTSKIYEDSLALAGQITNLDNKLTGKIYGDSLALAGQITTLNTNLTNEINTLKATDNALSTRIANDSANLKNNYYTKTETNTLFNQYCESDCITALKNRITELENQLANIISQFSPIVTTANVSNIAATTALCGGNVTNDGGKPVTARGVCWNTSANPTVSNSKTTDDSGTGVFTSNLTNLNPNTSYNVRAYATNCVGTAYGEDKTFTTLATINTSDVSNVTKNSAKCGGSFPTTNGSAAITERGVCWSTSQNPTLGTNNYTSNGTGTGSFTSDITGLSQGTTYYVRAYAKNAGGTAYGEQKTFTTPTVPTVTTTAASSITATSATSGGNVTATGGASVTARGVCWSTSQNPTLGTNNYTTDGNGTGSFTSSLSNLTPNTIYYVRAYATNSAGTTYGEQQTFTTITSAPIAIVVNKGNSGFSSDKTFYYTPGETYRQALVNHPENHYNQVPGWGKWEGGDLHTIFYKETSSSSGTKDMYIDGDSNFAPNQSSDGYDAEITLDSEVKPENHTFIFSYTQSELGGN